MEAIKQNDVLPVSLEEEMERSYLDYAMSVIVSRALPDVRDGMKPVHRRILFGMFESSCLPTKPHKKSARIVGEVMGKYHPHGDTAIYDSLVRMAQDFSLRLPLVDGQGNFGSMDGDAPAAMRYTESRLSKASLSLLESIYESTVDFRPNYDGSEEEPVVLPAQFPNLLVNGANGIAVGMATNIPPHNLGEVIDACCAYVDNNNITFEEIAEFVKGPDFPTGAMIMGHAGIRSAIATGRGSIIMRGKAEIETKSDNRQSIVITEIPYQVNKAKLVERIAELVNEKKIEGIASDGLRDESNKSGIRVVIDLKKDVIADVILNQLYSYTALQTSFGVNMLALDNGVPKLMNIKDVIIAFVNFREEVITRRTKHRLFKSRERAHILIGLATAVANIDEMIEMIKSSRDPVIAKEKLMSKAWNISSILPMVKLVEGENYIMLDGSNIKLSEEQAKAILEMRLQRLTGLEHQKINDELNTIISDIKEFMHILSSRDYMLTILKNELVEVKNMFATPRKTEIQIGEFEQDIEDLIPREEMVVIVTMGGYVKRVPLSTYRSQRRGGKGRSAISIKEEDATIDLFVASTHSPILFFSNFGKVYRLKTYKLPFGTPQSKGRAFVNLLPLQPGETITNVTILPENKEDWKDKQIIFCTQSGSIRRNDISDFENINAGGKIAMKLEEGDNLVGVALCSDNDHIMLAAKSGKAVRCPIEAVRVFKGRNSIGVRGIRLSDDDKVISMSILIGTVSEIEKRDIFLSIPLETRRDIAKNDDITDLYNGLEEEIKSALTIEEVKQFADKEQFILTVTENGYGKRSSAYEYRVTNRGGQGIINIVTSERNGDVISSLPIEENDHIMMLTNKGKVIRCPVKDIRISGRNTQGVKLFNTNSEEVVVSAVRIIGAEEDSDVVESSDEISEN